MIILARVTLYKHSSPHFHHNKALPTVCEQCEAPLRRDKDLIPVILCFYEIWGTELHVNTKTEIKTGSIAKAAKKKKQQKYHPLVTEVMVSILYSPN